MITKRKIQIYKKYKGDVDLLSRFGRKKEKKLFQNNEWSLIDSVSQDLQVIKNSLCSTDYKARLENTLHEYFDNEAIIELRKYLELNKND